MKDKLKLLLKLAKKQKSMLICAGVVIVGIVFCYWPTQGWFTELGQKVDQSIAVGTQVQTLLTRERHLPNVSLNATSGAVLSVYPTQDVYNKGLDAVTQLGKQSTHILTIAKDINQHVPLVERALPNGNDLDRAEFARVYKDAVEDDARIRNWPPADLAQPAYPIPPLMAGRRVPQDQITAELARQQDQINAQFVSKDATGQPTGDSKTQADAAYAQMQKILPLNMQLEAAKKFKVYLETGAIKPPAVYDQFKQAVSSLPAATCWNAQLWLWLDEDVATAVARANASATNVLDAPVKQILDVTIKDPPYLISGDPTAGNDTAALTPAPDVTPTGRVCNGMYDVVQFSISLDVDASRVPQVLDSLERGQFITVLSAQAQAVDPAERMLQGFVYGGGSIVRLDLVCEELLLHAWTSTLQPADAGPAKAAASIGSGGQATPSLLSITVHTNGG